MYYTFPCPKCEKKLKVQDSAAGQRATCPYCNHSLVVPPPPPSAAPSQEESSPEPSASSGLADIQIRTGASRPKRKKMDPQTSPPAASAPSRTTAGQAFQEQQAQPSPDQTTGGTGTWSDRTDVGIVASSLGGTILAAAFLAVLLPFHNTLIGELFFHRGWVPFVLTFFLGTSVAMLWLKWRKIKRQRRAMLFDLLPNEIAEDIQPDSVEHFLRHIASLPVAPSESFLIYRVVRGLEHFRVRKSNPEVAGVLASQSEIDANAVQSSYTLLQVFIWAIPILGFIGTVIGISAAVGGFSGAMDQASDINALKDSLNNVTGGLATAFDTTLVALVMSMLVMFPSSSLQKAEEDLLNSVDEYCNENLLKRLADASAGWSAGNGSEPGTLKEAVDQAMIPHHAELKAWGKKLESLGASLSEDIVAAWEKINDRIRGQQEQAATHVSETEKMAEAMHASVASTCEQAEEIQREAAETIQEAAESIEACFEAASQGLDKLNSVLEQLGEKKVVIQTKRRGWFSR